MYDYSKQLEAFRDQRVRLSSEFKDKLLDHRCANRNRIISRLPELIEGVNIEECNFKPQGSVAMGTVIQTKFVYEEYDIDDGLVISRSQLKNRDGIELSPGEVRKAVRESLKDGRFNRQPKFYTNCIRVFYAEEDKERHHVDFPVYRTWMDDKGETKRELATEGEWIESDPTQVNSWFAKIVEDKNSEVSGWGTQFRHLVQLLKRFCRSRKDWLDTLPNGMKLTMLVSECQPIFHQRIDEAFRKLLEKLSVRLNQSKMIQNLAHPDRPMITRTPNDSNVKHLLEKVEEASEQLRLLDEATNFNKGAARGAWDWIFKSDGFFQEYDDSQSESGLVPSTCKVLSRFDVPWRIQPSWTMELIYELSLSGSWSVSKNGGSWYDFSSDSSPLDKNLHLRFNASTNTPKPYNVFWQVVNTGNEAQAANCLRGEILRSESVGAGGLSSTTVPGLFRTESTSYKGMHWVECYIVKSGVCVARSGPFVVNIK